MKKLFVLVLLVALGAVGGAFWTGALSFGREVTTYRSVTVQRADIHATVSATGTIEPEEVVDVGAQVAGKIIRLGRDLDLKDKPIDHNSRVEAGYLKLTEASLDDLRLVDDVPAAVLGKLKPLKDQKFTSRGSLQSKLASLLDSGELERWQDAVLDRAEKGTPLAQIDEALYLSRVIQAKANLNQAEANVTQKEAKLRQCDRDYRRAKNLRITNAIGEAELEVAQSNYETTKAGLDVMVAAVKVARANLEEAKTNLAYTKIVSPINGIIVDRRVNVGQTVVAALNAPSLFLIAKDLNNMIIWASVNEADIALVQKAKKVTFTVPNDTTKYAGKVAKIRLNATMSSGVVTFPVDVSFDNSKANLLPYLTASIQFEWAEAKDVLVLPNSVLRWRPQPQQVVKDKRAEWGPKLRKRNQEGDKTALQVASDDPNKKLVVVWVDNGNGFVEPREVEIGLTDGVNTEIKKGLNEADPVVAGVERNEEKSKGLFLEGIGKMKQGGQ
jgi:HlyD family secretion protein